MKEGGTARMNSHAKHLRYVSRADAFQQKRKTYDEIDYLQHYPPLLREAILQSMQGPVPSPLPPLAPCTISYYRRTSQPIFKTTDPLSGQLQPHMAYQSLWLLASLEEKSFQDFPGVVKQFERQLPLYLSTPWRDIREMAVIAAGNKIIGKQSEILAVVEHDTRQLWVLANHVYEDRISFTRLFPLIPHQHELALKTLFQLSMLHDHDVADALAADQSALANTIQAAASDQETVRKYALRIIGNVIAVREELTVPLIQSSLLDILVASLGCSSGEVRRDAVWVLSNLATKKASAQMIISNNGLMAKLVDLFAYEALLHIKRELTFLFSYLAYYADQQQALELLAHPHLLQLCHSHLSIEDNGLSYATLRLLKELLEVGDSAREGEEESLVLNLFKQSSSLCSEISKKSYSENNEISSLSLQILAFLEEEE